MGNLTVDNPRKALVVEVKVNPHVHHPKRKSVLTAEHTHSTSAMGIVHHLLGRHLTRCTRHPLALYAMITPEEYVARMQQLRMERLLNEGYLYRQRL